MGTESGGSWKTEMAELPKDKLWAGSALFLKEERR